MYTPIDSGKILSTQVFSNDMSANFYSMSHQTDKKEHFVISIGNPSQKYLFIGRAKVFFLQKVQTLTFLMPTVIFYFKLVLNEY